MASWLVQSTLDGMVRVRTLARNIVHSVLISKTVYVHSASLNPCRYKMGTSKFNAGGNLLMN